MSARLLRKKNHLTRYRRHPGAIPIGNPNIIIITTSVPAEPPCPDALCQLLKSISRSNKRTNEIHPLIMNVHFMESLSSKMRG